ncbi:MAG: hypothetical protein R2712_23045 [Vicinamibacterales bacterium]
MSAVSAGRQWRLYRHLLRLSAGRLMDAALGSRDIGAEQVAIWGGTLGHPDAAVHHSRREQALFLRQLSLERLQAEALRDRLFFIVWAMLVAALLVALLWEALVPDRTDRQVLGVLPVAPRLVSAARLSASVAVVCSGVVATSLPTAMLYGLAGSVHPILGSMPGVIAGQIVATAVAGLFTCCALLVVRACCWRSPGHGRRHDWPWCCSWCSC